MQRKIPKKNINDQNKHHVKYTNLKYQRPFTKFQDHFKNVEHDSPPNYSSS